MERIHILINKLKSQYEQDADPTRLLAIVQQLQTELLQIQPQTGRTLGTSKVSVMMPAGMSSNSAAHERYAPKPVAEESVKEVKETILLDKGSVAIVQDNGQLDMVFDPMTEIPTLSHQFDSKAKPNVEPESLNDKLKQGKTELLELLKEAPVKDLRKAVGINDRFLFIDDLFRGDEAMYERSIKTINGFNIYPEAEYWISRELKVKLGWDNENKTVQHFDQIVKRRFS
ncbi:MAG: hypothetical protein H7Y42_02645 [Chitinophagaceae bacterium]|nr:hypothetical protein [Chitinophagaceae bacterium]